MRFLWSVFSILLFLAPVVGVAEESACPIIFVATETSSTDWRKTLSDLNNLPPVGIDTPTLKKGLANFWRDVRRIDGGFSTYDKVREELTRGSITPEEAKQQIARIAEASASVASQILKGNPQVTSDGRRRLEAHRVLLQSLSNLNQFADQQVAPKTASEKRREEIAKKKSAVKPADQQQQPKPGDQQQQQPKPGDQQQQPKPADQQQQPKPADQQQPKPGAQQQQPKPGAQQQQPKPGAQQQQPKPGAQQQQPKPGDQQQQPKPGDQQQQPKPGDQQQQPKPGDQQQQPKPGDQQQQPKPGNQQQQPKPGDQQQPGEGKPSQQSSPAQPGEGKPSQQSSPGQPGEGKPSQQSSPGQPGEGKPSQQSSPGQPGEGKPSQQSSPAQPGEGKPSQQSSPAQPGEGKPSQQSSPAQPGDQQLQPKPGDQQLQPKPGDQQLQPKPGDQQLQPKPGDQQLQPKPGDQQQQPKPGDQQQQQPKPGDQQQQQPKPGDQQQPKPGDQQQQPKPGDQQQQPKPGDQQQQPKPGDQQQQPKPGDQQQQPKPGDQQQQPKPGDQQQQPKPGDQQQQPKPGDQQQQPKPGDQQQQPKPGDQQQKPKPGDQQQQQPKLGDQQQQPKPGDQQRQQPKPGDQQQQQPKPGDQQQQPKPGDQQQQPKPGDQQQQPKPGDQQQQPKPGDQQQQPKPGDQQQQPKPGDQQQQPKPGDQQQQPKPGDQQQQQPKLGDQQQRPKPGDQQQQPKPGDQQQQPKPGDQQQQPKPGDQQQQPKLGDQQQQPKPGENKQKPEEQQKPDDLKKAGDENHQMGQMPTQKVQDSGDSNGPSQAGKSSGERSVSKSLLDLLRRFGKGPDEQKTDSSDENARKHGNETQNAAGKSARSDIPKAGTPDTIRDSKKDAQETRNDLTKKPSKEPKRATINKSIVVDSLQKALLKSLLIQSLRQYQSSEQVLFALKEFITTSQKYKTGGVDATESFLNIAVALKGELEALSASYRDFSQLSAEVQSGLREGGSTTYVKLVFLERVLSVLKDFTPLHRAEEKMLDHVRRLIANVQDRTPLSDQELVDQLLRQMPGPLGRNFIKTTYRAGDEIDYRAAAADVRNEKLWQLTMLSQLKRVTQFRSFVRPVPAESYINEGSKLPIEDIDPKFETADDLSYYRNIHRDGPMEYDIQRLASGDLSEKTYREFQIVRGQKNPKENEIYIMLYDISDSMRKDGRYAFQAALMASTVDTAQLRIAQGHKISFVAIPFGSSTGAATKISTPKEAAQFFKNMILNPPTSDSGTDITGAIDRGFKLIEEGIENGTELSRAHILVVTDGGDTIDVQSLLNKKEKLSKKVKISMHSLSMVQGNTDLETIANAGLSKGHNRSSYQFFSKEQMRTLMSPKANKEILNKAGQARKTLPSRPPTDSEVREIARALLELRNESEVKLDTQADADLVHFQKILKEPTVLETSDMATFVKALTEQNLAVDDSVSNRLTVRMSTALTFFSEIAKQNRTSLDDVIGQLTKEDRKQILTWITQ